MSSTAGDKIGIDTATPGGSSGVWGTEYFAATVLVDELAYAAREDRNLVVLGGGKFAWDGTDLTFTASLEFRNHITAFKVSVTTAASPITLNAAHKVAYVQITRKPGSDSNITSATVVAAGSLPNGVTDADMGTFVLAYRTADGTVYLPWAKKELLTGDHWQFGSQLTFFEQEEVRGLKIGAAVADTSQVKCFASAALPAVVRINGKLYYNTSDATMDLDTAGRSGLDTGTKAADTKYYLYGIPATSGRTFDLVSSASAASPTGFADYIQIGAFTTTTSSAVDHFFSRTPLLEYFRQKAMQAKPRYYCLAADATQVIVPASKNSPACVIIDGELYFNITNATMDDDTSGRNGLDTGAKAANTAYYLYAIPATSGNGFDLVSSVTAPSGAGPTGFNSWSYIGAFSTDEAATTITSFQASDGMYVADNVFEDETNTGDTNSNAKTFASLPSTATHACLNASIVPNAAGDSLRVTGNQSTTNLNLTVNGPVAAQATRLWGWIPIFTAQTIYMRVSAAAATSTANLVGFRENPMAWR